MAYTAVPTKSPGDVLTSTLWNTYVQGNFDSGVMRMLADSTLAAPAAAFDFTSIPGTFAHLMIDLMLGNDATAAGGSSTARLNGDSGANYDEEVINATGASVGASQVFGATSLSLAAPFTGVLFGPTKIFIPHYASTVPNKALFTLLSQKVGVASGNLTVQLRASFWRSSAAINRFTITAAGGGNFIVGSRATIYGLPA